MCRNEARAIIILIISLLIYSSAKVKAATIKGRVFDSYSHETIVGAAILVETSKSNTVSDAEGNYRLSNLPVGKYVILAKIFGYENFFTCEIWINNDSEEISFDIYLKPNHISLHEVQVNGKTSKETDISARNSEKNAENIINVVSSKAIELSPDLSVANVIGRVSGVTLERNSSGDGQYAIVRGMDKRFNYTMVNGVKIPGMDAKYRYVPLSIFPAELVDRLEVSKALTPNMEGDAIGGAVNMVMKDAPDKWKFTFNIAGGYNQIFMERKFAGFTTGIISSQSPNEIYGENYRANLNDFTKANMDVHKYFPLPNLVSGISAGNRFFEGKLGIIIAVSYMNSHKGSNGLLFTSETKTDGSNLPELTGMSDRTTSEKISQLGIHNKIDFKINERNKLQLYNAYFNFANAQYRESEGISFTNSYAPEVGSMVVSYAPRYRLNKQQLLSSILQGEHLLSENIKIQWSGVYAIAQNQTPDNTTISLFRTVENFQESALVVSNTASTRSWAHNSDNDLAGYLNFISTPTLAGLPIELSAGGLYRDKQRSSFFSEYQFFPTLNSDYKSIQGRDWNSISEIQWTKSIDVDNTNPLNFNAYEYIKAGYFQFKIQIKKIQVFGGLRAENTDQGYSLHYSKGDVVPVGEQTYTDLLPSLHLRYKPTGKVNIRGSYFRSVNRPGFLEIVPYLYNFEDYTEKGNPDLVHTVADNLDLRYEFFPKPLDQIMVGLFYKRIQNPIEYGWSLPQGSKGTIYLTPLNFGTAINYGAEFDFIRYFGLLGVKANYTWTHSKMTTSKRKKIRNEQGNLETKMVSQTRPLYGQSANIANLSLLFNDPQTGWDAQLSGIYTGDRIFLISQYLDDDQWQKGGVQIDASLEKKLNNGFSMFFKVNNLTNTPMRVYLKKSTAENYTYPNQDMDHNTLIRREYYKQTYLIGVRYKF